MIQDSINQLYDIFEQYTFPGRDFCRFCYSEEEIEYFTKTPIRLITLDHARTLLWESSDHWENSKVYRHYLPRLLELYGAPWFLEDIFTSSLFFTLIDLRFHKWPNSEQQAIIVYLEALDPEFKQRFSRSDYDEWKLGLEGLKNPDHDIYRDLYADSEPQLEIEIKSKLAGYSTEVDVIVDDCLIRASNGDKRVKVDWVIDDKVINFYFFEREKKIFTDLGDYSMTQGTLTEMRDYIIKVISDFLNLPTRVVKVKANWPTPTVTELQVFVNEEWKNVLLST